MPLHLSDEWENLLGREFERLSFLRLQRFIRAEREAGKKIFPSDTEVYHSFNSCPPDRVKVIIVGQDPYHTEGYADGLAFSVKVEKPLAPSLQNIFKELEADLGHKIPNHGCLLKWAKQGVLLLNSCLTVEADKPGSHREKGWELITDRVIEHFNYQKNPMVFILWGKDALVKERLITNPKHLVLKSSHPSPFSARVSTARFESFFGSRPFSTANKFLIKNDRKPIDWAIEDKL